MNTKYRIKDEPKKDSWTAKQWTDMHKEDIYLERVNFENYSDDKLDEIAQNAGYESITDLLKVRDKQAPENILCIKQTSTQNCPVGSLVVKRNSKYFGSNIPILSYIVDIYIVETEDSV